MSQIETAKALLYAATQAGADRARTAKLTTYAVVQEPVDATRLAKAVAYAAVQRPADATRLAKAVAYAVVQAGAPPPPDGGTGPVHAPADALDLRGAARLFYGRTEVAQLYLGARKLWQRPA